MSRPLSSLNLTHDFIARHVKPGDLCIDATAGRGHDTAFLCSLVGQAGRVHAFDIQPEAVESTRALLAQQGYQSIAQVHLDSHANMAAYTAPGTVSCIVFNFGWLPGGDHTINTRPESSIAAIQAGLELLRPGGVMSLCIYYGRDTGFAERDALLEFLQTVDYRTYSVLCCQFLNRPNCPPIPVFLLKQA